MSAVRRVILISCIYHWEKETGIHLKNICNIILSFTFMYLIKCEGNKCIRIKMCWIGNYWYNKWKQTEDKSCGKIQFYWLHSPKLFALVSFQLIVSHKASDCQFLLFHLTHLRPWCCYKCSASLALNKHPWLLIFYVMFVWWNMTESEWAISRLVKAFQLTRPVCTRVKKTNKLEHTEKLL